jgi:hypothetical protein
MMTTTEQAIVEAAYEWEEAVMRVTKIDGVKHKELMVRYNVLIDAVQKLGRAVRRDKKGKTLCRSQ